MLVDASHFTQTSIILPRQLWSGHGNPIAVSSEHLVHHHLE
jgi:hypothetical protein